MQVPTQRENPVSVCVYTLMQESFTKVFFSKNRNGKIKQWFLMIMDIGNEIIIYSEYNVTLPSVK